MISLILLPSSSVWVIWIITNWLTPGINYQLSVKKYLSPTGSALLSFLPWNNHFTVIQTRCTPAVVLVRVSTLLSFGQSVEERKNERKNIHGVLYHVSTSTLISCQAQENMCGSFTMHRGCGRPNISIFTGDQRINWRKCAQAVAKCQ